MKTILVFATILNGALSPIHDDDGPNEFPNYRACVLFAIRRAPQIAALLADAGFSEPVYWRCVR